MTQDQINQLAKQYVQQTVNSFLPYVNGAPTSFERQNPFSNYYDPNSDAMAQKNLFDQYYQRLNENYGKLAALRNQYYTNTYNTNTNYLNNTQQQFLNYQAQKQAQNYGSQMGGLQGNGVGSSSLADNTNYNLNNDYLNTLKTNRLDTQKGLDTASNEYNNSINTNNQDLANNQFTNAQNEVKDINSAVGTDTTNAYNRYQDMMNNYYKNYSYLNTSPH